MVNTREWQQGLLLRPVGERVRLLRELRGWSQGNLAELVGRSRGAVNGWERGRSSPRPAARRRLAELFDVPLDVMTAPDPD